MIFHSRTPAITPVRFPRRVHGLFGMRDGPTHCDTRYREVVRQGARPDPLGFSSLAKFPANLNAKRAIRGRCRAQTPCQPRASASNQERRA